MCLPDSWRPVQGREQILLQHRYDVEIARTDSIPAGTVLARSDADDDLLLELPGGHFALVHLSWSDDRAQLPTAAIFATCPAAIAAICRDSNP